MASSDWRSKIRAGTRPIIVDAVDLINLSKTNNLSVLINSKHTIVIPPAVWTEAYENASGEQKQRLGDWYNTFSNRNYIVKADVPSSVIFPVNANNPQQLGDYQIYWLAEQLGAASGALVMSEDIDVLKPNNWLARNYSSPAMSPISLSGYLTQTMFEGLIDAQSATDILYSIKNIGEPLRTSPLWYDAFFTKANYQDPYTTIDNPGPSMFTVENGRGKMQLDFDGGGGFGLQVFL